MIQQLAAGPDLSFEWVDILDPTKEEIHEIAGRYGIHDSSVEDLLQSDHLPKYEHVGPYVFIIFRWHADHPPGKADTVQELTDKIAIFFQDERIITFHKHEWGEISGIAKKCQHFDKGQTARHILNALMKSGLGTYDRIAEKLTREMEYYEKNVFLKDRKASLLEGLYYLKRKIDVTRRLIILTKEIIEKIDDPEHSDTSTRDTRDLFVKVNSVYDSLFENANHILTIYFSISSQRTNEIIRVLTIFSVFFMPLTFIVGIYGMNFEFMPELKSRLGYPLVLAVMVGLTLAIYFWFRRRGWL